MFLFDNYEEILTADGLLITKVEYPWKQNIFVRSWKRIKQYIKEAFI